MKQAATNARRAGFADTNRIKLNPTTKAMHQSVLEAVMWTWQIQILAKLQHETTYMS